MGILPVPQDDNDERLYNCGTEMAPIRLHWLRERPPPCLFLRTVKGFRSFPLWPYPSRGQPPVRSLFG